jgi:hypothetical protein
VSNPARPRDLCQEWGVRIAEEYFSQVNIHIQPWSQLKRAQKVLSFFIDPFPCGEVRYPLSTFVENFYGLRV